MILFFLLIPASSVALGERPIDQLADRRLVERRGSASSVSHAVWAISLTPSGSRSGRRPRSRQPRGARCPRAWPTKGRRTSTRDRSRGARAGRPRGPRFSALCRATSGPGHDCPRASTVAVMTSIRRTSLERGAERSRVWGAAGAAAYRPTPGTSGQQHRSGIIAPTRPRQRVRIIATANATGGMGNAATGGQASLPSYPASRSTWPGSEPPDPFRAATTRAGPAPAPASTATGPNSRLSVERSGSSPSTQTASTSREPVGRYVARARRSRA